MGCITDPCRIVFNEVIFMMPQKTACIEDGSTKKLLLCSLARAEKMLFTTFQQRETFLSRLRSCNSHTFQELMCVSLWAL